MRIAHLDTGRTWQGGQAQALRLMRELRARGHEQWLLAPEGPLLERARTEGFAARRWDARGEWDLPALLFARRRLLEDRPDVAHLHSAHAHAIQPIRICAMTRLAAFRAAFSNARAVRAALLRRACRG